MKIRIGYELIYDCPQPTPMILTLSVHYTRVSDIVVPDHMVTSPPVPLTAYRDSYGNWCSRIVAPKGELRLSTDALVNDTGRPDAIAMEAGRRRWKRCPTRRFCSCWGAAIARPIGYRKSRGPCLAIRRWVGPVCRRSATTFIITSHSAMNMRVLPRRPGRPSRKRPVCAVTTRTLPSRFAAA